MATMPPPPPKELPKRASPRHTPRHWTTSTSLPIAVKLGGAADAVARLKAYRTAINNIQSTNLLAKRFLDDTEKVINVGPDGGLDVQAMSFVVQRRNSVEETARKEDDSHARMKEVGLIAEQKRIAQSTPQFMQSQQMLERVLPAEQVAQSRIQYGYGAGGAAPPLQQQAPTSSAMLNPYSVARPSSASAGAMTAAPATRRVWQPTNLYNTAPSPYPGVNNIQFTAPAYSPQQPHYPVEQNNAYNANYRGPAYGSPYPGVQPQAGVYPLENPRPQQGFYAI